MSLHLKKILKENFSLNNKLYFFDAAAPIVTKESINFDIAFFRK